MSDLRAMSLVHCTMCYSPYSTYFSHKSMTNLSTLLSFFSKVVAQHMHMIHCLDNCVYISKQVWYGRIYSISLCMYFSCVRSHITVFIRND